MDIILRGRILIIVIFIFSSLILWSILPKIIQSYLQPIEISGYDFVNNPIKGKIKLSGRFEYLSCAKEYFEKDGKEYAGSDYYYYLFIPQNTDKGIYVKSSLQPVYLLLSYGTEMSMINGLVEKVSDNEYQNIISIIPPRISLSVNENLNQFLKPNIQLNPEIIAIANYYLFVLGNQEFKSVTTLNNFIINISYSSSMIINFVLLIFFGILELMSMFLFIIGFLVNRPKK